MCIHIYIYIEREREIIQYIYIYIYIYERRARRGCGGGTRRSSRRRFHCMKCLYGQFSRFHVCFCGLDPGNLKFETVRTNKQHICF